MMQNHTYTQNTLTMGSDYGPNFNGNDLPK